MKGSITDKKKIEEEGAEEWITFSPITPDAETPVTLEPETVKDEKIHPKAEQKIDEPLIQISTSVETKEEDPKPSKPVEVPKTDIKPFVFEHAVQPQKIGVEIKKTEAIKPEIEIPKPSEEKAKITEIKPETTVDLPKIKTTPIRYKEGLYEGEDDDSDVEIDPRLERLMPKSKTQKVPSLATAKQAAAKEKDPRPMPWEIDIKGQPLKERVKEPTPYELWLEDKTEKEGKYTECPKCGFVNYDLAFVTGQKCKSCGYSIEEFENLSLKMAERDEEMGVFGATRLSTDLGVAGTNLGVVLAVPHFLRESVIQPFEFTFKSHSFLIYLLSAIVFCIIFVLILPLIFATSFSIFNLIILILVILVGISIFTGFARTSRVTSITVNDVGVTFSGLLGSSSTRMNYDKIIAITNKREINGWTEMSKVSRPIWDTIVFLFTFIIFNFIFGIFFFWVYWLNHKAGQDPFASCAVDSSSGSFYYTNNICISTATNSVEYSYSGAANLQFVRALAIIIYMAKKRNRNCHIDPAAIRAAEKGQEHYQLWRRSHGI